MRAGGRIGEGQRHILGAHVAAVDAVGAARAALDPADDLELLALAVGAAQHDLGEIARRAGGGAREDDVVHPARAHRLGAGFAHHPADRFEQVGLAAAVGADDAGQARFDAQFGGLDEALETAELEPPELHRRCPRSRITCAPARWSIGSSAAQPFTPSSLLAVDDEGRRAVHPVVAWRNVSVASASVLEARHVGQAGLGLVRADAAAGEEIVEAADAAPSRRSAGSSAGSSPARARPGWPASGSIRVCTLCHTWSDSGMTASLAPQRTMRASTMSTGPWTAKLRSSKLTAPLSTYLSQQRLHALDRRRRRRSGKSASRIRPA